MNFQPPIPVLRIFDETKARDFYVRWLGFQVDWEHRFAPDMPLYMQVSRGAMVLHLTEHHGDCCPGAKVFIGIDDVAGFLQELRSRPYAHLRPGLEEAPWNATTLTLTDPFHNQLLFSQPKV